MSTKIITPDPLAPFADKITPEYGIKIGDFIESEWFNGGISSTTSNFRKRNELIENNRLYVRGEQDTQSYKNVISRQTNDKKYLNLDWRIVNVCEKFTSIVSNGMSDEYYKVDVRATDRYSMLARKKKIMDHKKNMKALPMLKKAKEILGIDFIPEEYIPEDEDDLNYQTKTKDRPRVEIAEEVLINIVKNWNKWNNIKEQYDKDLVEIGLGGVQVYTDPQNGVCLRIIDPENAVHSFVKKNDFSDAYYYGVVDTITISDIKRESNGELSDIQLRQIAKSYGNSSGIASIRDYERCDFNDIIDTRIHILRFCWKTNKSVVYKKYNKNGNVTKVAKRDEKYSGAQVTDKSRVSQTYDTWLEGNKIVGSKFIYGYQEAENIVFDELNKPMSPFIFRATNIYKNQLHSFLSNIIPLCDQMQYAHLKIQHLMSELKPDLINISIDSLADISGVVGGSSKQKVWEEAISILNVKGVVISKDIDMGEAGIKAGVGAKPMPMSQGSGLASLLNIWAHYYNQVREVTGINPARDGSLPADALLGVNKMAQLASNTVTKHIVKASVDLDLRVCETISSRIKSIFKFKKEAVKLIEMYTQAVGKENMEAMDAMKDRHLADFGFTMNMVPSVEELNSFKEDLGIALQEGSINVEDKIEAQQISKTSVKEANEFLKYARKRNLKIKMQESSQKMQEQTQGNIQSTQAASEAKIKEYIAKSGIDVETAGKMSQIRLAEKQAMIQIEAPVEDKEFKQEVYLTNLENINKFNTTKYLEEGKDNRVDKKSTNEGQLINQRQNNLAPVNFENSELGGGIDFNL